jgi:hypothetical protein
MNGGFFSRIKISGLTPTLLPRCPSPHGCRLLDDAIRAHQRVWEGSSVPIFSSFDFILAPQIYE